MVDKKYKPTIRLTRDIKGFNPETRHPVVREVIFSTAVQHGEGGAANIIRRALGTDASQFSDKEVIKRSYYSYLYGTVKPWIFCFTKHAKSTQYFVAFSVRNEKSIKIIG